MPEPAPPPTTAAYEVVVIGASTGGPRALAVVLAALPAELGVGLVVAQHMPAGFTRSLAARLDRCCPLRVAEAHDGAAVRPGEVLIAPGGAHTTLERHADGLVVRVDREPSPLLHRPSVDLLFRSAAETAGPRAIGVVLTGMGSDGALGLDLLRGRGARTLVESRETSLIFGMPRAAASAAEQILPLPVIGPRLAELCGPRGDAAHPAGPHRPAPS